LKELGDGILASFSSVSDAVYCAGAIMEAVQEVQDLNLSIGIHLGEVVFKKGDIFGDGVNIASRIVDVAQEGEIMVSDAVYKNIKNQEGIRTEFIKVEQLKNVEESVEIYKIEMQYNLAQRVEIISELKRRNVLRATIVYILTALVFWKVADISIGLLNLPENTLEFITLALIVFFPIAMLMAWLFERSPQGFIRVGSTASRDNPFTDTQKKPLTSNTFIILLIATVVALFLIYPQSSSQQASDIQEIDKSIAVIPFTDISPEGDQKYLADGVMEAILNHLAKIKDLRVISRNTMEMYRGSNKSTPSIASEVGVSYVLEGICEFSD